MVIFVAVGALIAGVVGVGALLPRRHTASCTALFDATPDRLYAIVRDFATQPSWRHGLRSVEMLPSTDRGVRFREIGDRQAITYLVLEDELGKKLVLKIADETLPFGGTWSFAFGAEDGKTRLRITEDGEVKNVIFRFFARFVFGYTATMEQYLRDLERKTSGAIGRS